MGLPRGNDRANCGSGALGSVHISGTRQTGKDGSVVNGQRVLVVDGMHEIQDVLRAVLAPRGLRVDWVRSHAQQLPGEAADRPDILVIDAETRSIPPSEKDRRWNLYAAQHYVELSGRYQEAESTPRA